MPLAEALLQVGDVCLDVLVGDSELPQLSGAEILRVEHKRVTRGEKVVQANLVKAPIGLAGLTQNDPALLDLAKLAHGEVPLEKPAGEILPSLLALNLADHLVNP